MLVYIIVNRILCTTYSKKLTFMHTTFQRYVNNIYKKVKYTCIYAYRYFEND